MNISVPIEGTSEVISSTQISPLVSKCCIKVLYVDHKPNRNGTVITKEVAEEIGRYLPGSPIVGYYNETTKDFEQHNKMIKMNPKDNTFKLVDMTQAYGYVDSSARVWFQEFQDADGVRRLYLCTEGYIWTEAFPDSKRIIDSGNNQSMELNDDLEGSWGQDKKTGARFFIINKALIEKLCVLGEDYEPCFEGAQIATNFALQDQIESLRISVYNMMNKMKEGGLQTTMEVKDNAMTTEYATQEEEKKEKQKEEEQNSKNSSGNSEQENQDKNQSNTEGNNEEEEKKKKYNLSEIPEYVDLLQKYTELQNSYAAIEQENKQLKEEAEPLRTFKLEKEREDKENMIKKFYMVSDEDKKDIVDNIDSYSLDEIESKLSVICFRNKLGFSEEESDEAQEDMQLTYALNNAADRDIELPAWIQAVSATEKSMQ